MKRELKVTLPVTNLFSASGVTAAFPMKRELKGPLPHRARHARRRNSSIPYEEGTERGLLPRRLARGELG